MEKGGINMYFGYETSLSILLLIAGLVITVGAQIFVKSSYGRYRAVRNKKGITGFEAARKILDKEGLTDIHVVEVRGELSDHYDPRRKVVRLSTDIFHGNSIASVAVAAHEAGHAIQHKQGYLFMRIRSIMFPIVSIGSKLGYFAVFIGFIAGIMDLINIGIILLIGIILFELITLPVEYDASSKAKRDLIETNLLDSEELPKVNSMLSAAALTYVAAVAASLLQILRLILMARNRN
jgi:uncharacterized protein